MCSYILRHKFVQVLKVFVKVQEEKQEENLYNSLLYKLGSKFVDMILDIPLQA